MPKGVLLDTSFFLRFLNVNDPLFKNSEGYFRYFLEKEHPLFISTISVAEFCVGGAIEQLPLRNLKILPFNLTHATRTGEFARTLFQARRDGKVDFTCWFILRKEETRTATQNYDCWSSALNSRVQYTSLGSST